MRLWPFERPRPTAPPALTAAAAPVQAPRDELLRHPDAWQNEVWAYHDSLGEFNYGVWWLSNMLSRVRLRAAKLAPGADEPEIHDTGPAAELMMRLGGGPGGQAQLMKRITVQLSVPGEGYMVGEERDGVEKWMVRSVDEIRAQNGTYYVMDEASVHTGRSWREVAPDNLVFRVWRPHDRYYHMADSPARSARETMRELELVNRKIQSEYLSRLASAGIVKIPDELTFQGREEFLDAANPWMEEFIAVAAEAIKTPGTAASLIPIPVVGPAEALKSLEFVDFTVKIDEKIIEKRDSAIKRLATKLDMPADILLGLGDVNHWSAWQLEEGALKAHIAPLAELICDAVTQGYLTPRLQAGGEDPTDWVVWYDMSELALRPDRSQGATEAYDRLEINGEAYRRELGFDEEDAPTPEDLGQMGLRVLLRTVPNAGPAALDKLAGSKLLDEDLLKPAAPAPLVHPPGETPPEQGKTGPPAAEGKRGAEVPAKVPQAAEARLERLSRQASVQHAIIFGTGSRWDLKHPEVCKGHVYDCPYTYAISTAAPLARPQTSGLYLCHLDAFGLVKIDGPAPYLDTTKMISTDLLPVRSNGHVRT